MLATATAAETGSESSPWGQLLDGARHADWEAVDGELRQFLARLGGLAEAPDGYSSPTTWPWFLGVATALVAARRGSIRRRGLFRRAAPRESGTSSHRPIPVGPWPLGSP